MNKEIKERFSAGLIAILSFALWVAIFIAVRFWIKPQVLVRYILLFAVVFGLSALFVRYIDKRSVASIGYMFHSRWIKEYLQGVLIGALSISAVFFFNLSMGYYEIVSHNITPSLLLYIFTYAMILSIFASAFEELAFRGYAFQNLMKASNAVIAIIFFSVLFGIGHLWNTHASWLSVLNTIGAGVLFALGYIKTKSLWLPSGLHFSWNFFQGRIFSLTGGGAKATKTLLDVKQQGPSTMTGGEYGPEGGIPALVVFIIACFVVYFWPKIKVAPDMAKLWTNQKPKK
jgi:membrane protease YdiL (CAAX protease family)